MVKRHPTMRATWGWDIPCPHPSKASLNNTMAQRNGQETKWASVSHCLLISYMLSLLNLSWGIISLHIPNHSWVFPYHKETGRKTQPMAEIWDLLVEGVEAGCSQWAILSDRGQRPCPGTKPEGHPEIPSVYPRAWQGLCADKCYLSW